MPHTYTYIIVIIGSTLHGNNTYLKNKKGLLCSQFEDSTCTLVG